jgi:hypothetical protein
MNMLLKVCLFIGTVLPSLAFANFPFPNGLYDGESICHDESGATTKGRVQLKVREDTMETTYHLSEGILKTTKKAAFDSMGFFTLSGKEIVRGRGYCTARFCHYQAVMNLFGTIVEGEDSLFMVDGKLQRIGSALNGEKVMCEETYHTFVTETSL